MSGIASASGTNSAPWRICSLCGRPEHGSAACSTQTQPMPEIIRAHAIWGADYPALEAVWNNPEDEVAFDVSEAAKALIRAPLEDELAECYAEIARLSKRMRGPA